MVINYAFRVNEGSRNQGPFFFFFFEACEMQLVHVLFHATFLIVIVYHDLFICLFFV